MSISSSVTFSSSRSKLSMPSIFIRALVIMVILTSNFPQKSDAQFQEYYCIADAHIPDGELQTAMDWACGNGADCGPIQPNKPCYEPNTIKDHASYAFNSYYQRRKHIGGTCYFNGSGLYIGVNPSHGACQFEYIP